MATILNAKFVHLLVFFSILSSSSGSIIKSSRDTEADSRISGGSEATLEDVPYFVNIVDTSFGDSRLCGGVIYLPTKVITSANCLYNEDIASPSYLSVIAGSYTDESGYVQKIALKEIVLHEDFNSFTNENDIALLTLSEELDLSSPQVQAIDLPAKGDVPSGICLLSGLGTAGSTLMSAEMTIISNTQCENLYESPIPPGDLCALESNAAFCSGDEGDPFACTNTDHTYLGGIASWGYGCIDPSAYPSVFTDVSKFLDWISANNL